MSTFNISDITFAGAYVKAVATAKNSDQGNAARHLNTGEGMNVVRFLKDQARHIATAIVDMRPAANQLRLNP